MTQTAVEPEQTFDYSFIAPDAGTYWYHSHNRSWEQVARGLYGPLIIDEVDLPDVDQDITLMIDDWRLDKSGAISNDFGAMHDNSHGGRLGNFATVNGKADSIYPVKTHERLRLRLINAANARIFQLGIKGLNGSIVALDGMPLETPQPIDLITLAPAQRADLIVDVVAETGGEAVLYMQERDTSYALTDFEVTSQAAGAKRESITSLPPNPVAVVNNLSNALTVPIVMEGGAMGGLQTATYQGQELDMRALVNAGQVWALNGVAGLTDEPLFRVSRGEAVRLSFTNKTAFPHGMHLHGHHFHELGPQNQMGALRDTTLINPRETRDVAFIADNPGKWLIHCHMLGHQATGMKTWIEVKGQPNWRTPGDDGVMPAPPHDETGHTWHHDGTLLFNYTKFGGEQALKMRGITGFKSGMPAVDEALSDNDIWDILSYIRSTWTDEIKTIQSQRTSPH